MLTVKFTTGSLMLWAYFSAGGPGHLVQHRGFYEISTDKKFKPDQKSYNGPWLELPSGQ